MTRRNRPGLSGPPEALGLRVASIVLLAALFAVGWDYDGPTTALLLPLLAVGFHVLQGVASEIAEAHRERVWRGER